MSVFAIALGAQFVVIVYFLATTLVLMFPWNDLKLYTRRELTLEAGVNALILGVILVAFATGNRLAMVAATIAFGLFLLAQLWIWWRPYLFGASPAEAALYAAHFQSTTKILPARGGNPTPDAQHAVLQLLSAAALLAMIAATLAP